ncbi:uncharacterized protein [Primulina eburnea]|uniref:uncharacterized protein n=1 Tax=Primulina eburnea TaxID=1245227 RepID=UPI003C6C4BD2
MMEENPRDWPMLLSETLWAYRTSKRTANGVSTFSLTFGHDAVLPLEINVPSMRVAKQNELSLEHYNEAMIMELKELDELRIQAYNALLLQKQKVARIYNKRIKKKSFHEGEILWKAILPLGHRIGIWANGLPTGRDHSRDGEADHIAIIKLVVCMCSDRPMK